MLLTFLTTTEAGILPLYLFYFITLMIYLQLYANYNVLLDSFENYKLGEIIAIKVVKQFPPILSLNK